MQYSVYCERHNLWYWPGDGCKICKSEGPRKPAGLERFIDSYPCPRK
ncbi:MAG TPA: hypothetical protein VLY21_00830 [Nitrososphaerales archaeon]|nr:hypothetical protein [Nitrososphaerales archaeon]